MQTIKFEQLPLFTGGHRLLTVELYLHMDGSRDHIEIAYGIRTTDTAVQIEAGTLGVIGMWTDTDSVAPVIHQLTERARMHLLPF